MQCKDRTPLFAALCISSYWLHWSSRAGYFLVVQNALFLGTIKEFLTWVLFTVASQLHSISLSGKYFCNSERQQDLEKGLGFSNVSERLSLASAFLQMSKNVENISENILLCIPLQLITEGRWVSVELVIKGKTGLLVIKYLYIWLKCLGRAKNWPVVISFMCNWWCNHTVLVCFAIRASQAAKNYCEHKSYRISCMKFVK